MPDPEYTRVSAFPDAMDTTPTGVDPAQIAVPLVNGSVNVDAVLFLNTQKLPATSPDALGSVIPVTVFAFADRAAML